MEPLPFEVPLGTLSLVAGAPLKTPARRLRSFCLVRQATGPLLELHYGEAGNVAYVRVDWAIEEWWEERRTRRKRWPDDPLDGAPVRIYCDARTAGLRFTEDLGMYLRKPGKRRPATEAAWNGVAVDLTDGGTPQGHWDDYFPTSDCHEVCLHDHEKPRFGICIDATGRICGIFVEAPADQLPQPANSVTRTRSSGRWPDVF